VIEVGRAGARILGRFVVAPEAHGFGVQRMAAEGRDVVGRHRPALQGEAAHRIGGKLAEVVRLDGAEIALGGDMQAHRLAHVGAEAPGEPLRAALLVHVVDAAPGRILAEIVDHVADVVQQRGEHGGGRCRIGFSERRRLQGVLQLADLAQTVAPRGPASKDLQEFLAEGIAHAPRLP
jgi:hypothetical protein